MKFSEKLRNIRVSQNLSQKELAEKIGVSERSIYAYEQTGAYPRRGVMEKLANALNLTTDFLHDDDVPNMRVDVDKESFISNAKKSFGYKGGREAQDVLTRTAALFAGGELDDRAKDFFFQSIMAVYLESKAEARDKFAPNRRVSRKKKD